MPEIIRRPSPGHINLRGSLADARFSAAVSSVLGVGLPAVANTVVQGSAIAAYWLGPDEWLVATSGEREAALAAALREALADTFSSVTEVGSGNAVIVLRGAEVRELLSKECPLDLREPAFAPGACAQTRLAKAAILLRPLEADSMELIVRRSFADYVWSWLLDAGAEYGFRAGSGEAPAHPGGSP